MYKQVVIFSLLAAAATTFPSSGLDDLGPSRPDGQVLPAENKSLNQIAESSGNPVELIEASANSTARTRKARGCVLSLAWDCSESTPNLTAVYEDDQKKLAQGFAYMAGERDKIYNALQRAIDRMFPASESSGNSVQQV